VSVTVCLSQCACHSVSVTVCLSQCVCHSVSVTVQLSQCVCQNVSHFNCHSPPIAVCHSSPQCGRHNSISVVPFYAHELITVSSDHGSSCLTAVTHFMYCHVPCSVMSRSLMSLLPSFLEHCTTHSLAHLEVTSDTFVTEERCYKKIMRHL